MSTSGKRGSKILGVISRGKAERLLVDWANLPLDWATDQGQLPLDRVLAARKRMLALYPDVFEGLDDRQLIVVLCEVQRFLRKAWDSSDDRHRNWYLTTMRNSFHELAFVYKTPDEEHWTEPFYNLALDADRSEQVIAIQSARVVNKQLSEPPPITPFEAAADYFQRIIANRARHCAGGCEMPYFIAIKRWQKYCSEACAGPATREAKRRWWNENRGGGGGGR